MIRNDNPRFDYSVNQAQNGRGPGQRGPSDYCPPPAHFTPLARFGMTTLYRYLVMIQIMTAFEYGWGERAQFPELRLLSPTTNAQMCSQGW